MFVCLSLSLAQVREFVSLFGLLTSCPEGRILLATVSTDPACSVNAVLKPVMSTSADGSAGSP